MNLYGLRFTEPDGSQSWWSDGHFTCLCDADVPAQYEWLKWKFRDLGGPHRVDGVRVEIVPVAIVERED